MLVAGVMINLMSIPEIKVSVDSICTFLIPIYISIGIFVSMYTIRDNYSRCQ